MKIEILMMNSMDFHLNKNEKNYFYYFIELITYQLLKLMMVLIDYSNEMKAACFRSVRINFDKKCNTYSYLI